MKHFLTPLLFTLTCLLSISANSGAPSYFIPNEPTITAPAANAADVDITPELTSSEFNFTKDGMVADPTLSASNWIISKKSDKITILGGAKTSTSPDSRNINNKVTYDISLPIKISDKVATSLNIYFNDDPDNFGQAVEVKDELGETIFVSVIELFGFKFQAERMFLAAKTLDNAVLIQSHLQAKVGESKVISEFILADAGLNEDGSAKQDIFGWRSNPNDYSNTLFDSQNNLAYCNYTGPGDNQRTFKDWKDIATPKNEAKFSLACFSTPIEGEEGKFEVTYASFTSPEITQILPEINEFSSDSNLYTLESNEVLAPYTEYMVQVQHTGAAGNLVGASNWSKPISFTTRSANTNYQVTVPTDLAFTAEQAKDLAFKIANTGSEDGAPIAIIRLPFEALKAVNGNVNDFFNVSVGGQSCAMAQKNGKTDFTCQLNALKANGTADLKAKITVKDTAIKSIEYKVCDAEKCDATDFTALSITVKTPTDPAPSTPAPGKTETTSSSSSSGGSMFWLFLMAPLLLVRRK